MSKEEERIDKKFLLGERTYRVSTRMEENHPEVRFFVSPRSHRLYHLQKTLYPNYAGKVNVDKLSEEELKELPKGFRLLDRAIRMRFNRDLANYSRNRFHSATQEELTASKFKESSGFKRKAKVKKKE